MLCFILGYVIVMLCYVNKLRYLCFILFRYFLRPVIRGSLWYLVQCSDLNINVTYLPWTQGSETHSSMSFMQSEPVKPPEQRQW